MKIEENSEHWQMLREYEETTGKIIRQMLFAYDDGITSFQVFVFRTSEADSFLLCRQNTHATPCYVGPVIDDVELEDLLDEFWFSPVTPECYHDEVDLNDEDGWYEQWSEYLNLMILPEHLRSSTPTPPEGLITNNPNAY